MRILGLPRVVGVGLCVFGAHAQPLDYRPDQQHDWPNELEAYHSIQALAPVQEFTPTLGGMDVVEVWTLDMAYPVGNGVGATLELVLREDTVGGRELATSAPVVLADGWDAPTRFEFPGVVWMTPETRHAFEVRVLAGDNWGVRSHGILYPVVYPRGRYIVGGKPSEAVDAWFRTGLRVPRPAAALEGGTQVRWQGVPGLSYRVWGSATLQDWGELGQLQAVRTNCVVTNLPSAEPKLFFKVSQP